MAMRPVKILNNFVKSTGDWHLSDPDSETKKTLCNKPMIGINYSLDFVKSPEKVKPCKVCIRVADRMYGGWWKGI